MANRYWVGGTASWDATAGSKWATTSGGAGGASVPTSSDDVFFDVNSGAVTVTVPFTTNADVCNNFTCTGFTGTLTLSQVITVWGSIVLGSGMTLNGGNASLFSMKGTGSHTLTTNGVVGNARYNFGGTSGGGGGGTYTLQDNLVTTGTTGSAGSMSLISGTLNANNKDVTIGFFDTGSTDVRTLNMGTGTWTLTSRNAGNSNEVFGLNPSTNLTLNPSTSTIKLTDGTATGKLFNGRDKTFANIWFSGSGTGRFTVAGNNTFNEFKVDAGKSIYFDTSGMSPPIQTVTTLTAVGTLADPIIFRSTSPPKQHAFYKTSGTVSAEFIDMQDSVGYGGATFNNYRGVDSGHNSGWNFTGPVAPVAAFTQNVTSGVRPLTVNFTDQSTGGELTDWLWTFGDGDTSTLQNPSHEYASAGTYTVSLKVTNIVGDNTVTKTSLITATVTTYTREAKGTLLFSGSLVRTLYAYRSATGTLKFSGSGLAIRRINPSIIEKKTYMWKVYDEAGNFLEVLDDVIPEPNWAEEMNTTGSSMMTTLARNSYSLARTTESLLDNNGATILDINNAEILTLSQTRNKVGPGSSINHNNRIDLYVFYGENGPILDNNSLPILDNNGDELVGTIGAPNGIRRFTGFISEINTKYGDDENTDVQLMSYGFDLDQYPVVTPTGDTTVAFNSYDQGDMVREALEQFKTDGIGTYTDYSLATVADTGFLASYTFRVNTYKELLDKAVQLAPAGWYYRVGLGDNLVYFKPKPSSPNHVFFLGKHIKSLNLRSYNGDTVNDVIYTGGSTDPTDPLILPLFVRKTVVPVTGTRRGLNRTSDSRVTLVPSAEILSDGLINEGQNIQYRTTLDILDRTYDIESIAVGDLVGFANFDNQVDDITMQVVALNYTPDVINLQLDSMPKSMPKRLEELRKSLLVTDNSNVPDAPAPI